MFGYYLDLAWRSLRRSPVLTALMVLAIALGIGASMTTLTVFRVLAADPLPHKSDRVFHVQLDAATRNFGPPGGEPLEQLTRTDAEALLRDRRGARQAMMSAGRAMLQSTERGIKPYFINARQTSADFFAMFDTPWRHGQAWSADEDAAEARVAVISDAVNQKIFGGENSVGRMLQVGDHQLRIVGVLAPWRPVPHFYDLTTGQYAEPEDVYLPFSTARALNMGSMGNMNCWANAGQADRRGLNVPCSWIQYWVELPNAQDADAYRRYLVDYSEQQLAAGRFERPSNVRLRSVGEWLDFKQVVPSDVRLQVWLALGFLLVCLTNTVGLLLAKCLRRSAEIGVRRALGASRRAIFGQFLVESGVIGLAGGLLGLGLAMLGLWGVRQNPTSYAPLAQIDPPMLLATIALALVASVLAGLLPAWRACQVTPAVQLKSQ
jgi:putative ABC transport system permease protein